MTNINSSQNQTKAAIITGASRGIGLAIAQRLTSQGIKVCITARNEEALKEAAATMPEGTAIYVAGKADDPEHREEVMNRVAEEFGGLDILINNAGINPIYGNIVDTEIDAIRKVFDVNVISTIGWIRAAVKHEKLDFKNRNGKIVNLSSVTGNTPSPGIGVYGVTKAAVSHLTTTLATELGPEIRVNAIAPAVIKTNFAKALYEGREEEISADYPLKRLGVPDDIAGAAAFLISDDASWITGQTLIVDGGLLSAGGKA